MGPQELSAKRCLSVDVTRPSPLPTRAAWGDLSSDVQPGSGLRGERAGVRGLCWETPGWLMNPLSLCFPICEIVMIACVRMCVHVRTHTHTHTHTHTEQDYCKERRPAKPPCIKPQGRKGNGKCHA